jgi:parallel beta-helix repeat protein
MATEVKGTTHHRLAWVLGALVIAAIVSIFSAEPQAATHWVASCGAYLTGDETYILVGDIQDCEAIPAVTVVGPAKLQLNGFSISCAEAEDSVGILVEGHDGDVLGTGRSTARPNANTVTGCVRGVVVSGDGKHRVQGVTVTKSTAGAFVVESDENKIVSNLVRQSRIWSGPNPVPPPVAIVGSGFVVEGNNNLLVANSAADVEAEEDTDAGFNIQGNENVLEGNISKDNEAYGFFVGGEGNVLDANTALKNLAHAFFLADSATANVLKHNKAVENGDEVLNDGVFVSGFHVEGSENRLEENLATRNGLYAIHLIEGATGNVVTRNTASDSLGWDGGTSDPNFVSGSRLDLVDDNVDCGTNRWSLNVFGVRSQACIK